VVVQVGAGTLVTFPVQADTNRSIVTALSNGVMANLQNVTYSMSMWLSYQIYLVHSIDFALMELKANAQMPAFPTQARSLGAAALQKPDGTVVVPNTTSVKSAVEDYLSSGATAFDLMLLGQPPPPIRPPPMRATPSAFTSSIS
jgi:hypothetical protein